jgi:predicted methyltransferase
MGVKQGMTVQVTTSQGGGEFTAVLDDATPTGVVYVPANQENGAALGTDAVVRVKTVSAPGGES